MELGDNGTYAIDGIISTYFKLDSGMVLHVEDIMFVRSLKKNLLSIGVLEDKGCIVSFSKGKSIMCPLNEGMSSTMEIMVKVGNVYRLLGNPI